LHLQYLFCSDILGDARHVSLVPYKLQPTTDMKFCRNSICNRETIRREEHNAKDDQVNRE